MAHEDPLVGHRVVVRSRIPGERGPSGGPAMTDVIGVVELADDQVIVVRRRDGVVRTVRRVDVVVVKRVPPPPRQGPRNQAR